jgi:hypothetical protein
MQPENNVSIAQPVLLLWKHFFDTSDLEDAYEKGTFEGGLQTLQSMLQVFSFDHCSQSTHSGRAYERESF